MAGSSHHGSKASTSTHGSQQPHYNSNHNGNSYHGNNYNNHNNYNNNNNNYHGNKNHYRKRRPRGFFGLLIFAIKTAYTSTRSFIIVGKMRGKPIILTDHARERMEQRHITIDEIKQALKKGKLNDRKSEPREKPFPKYVVDAQVRNNHPQNKGSRMKEIEIVLAAHKDESIVITVIDKDTDWETPDGH